MRPTRKPVLARTCLLFVFLCGIFLCSIVSLASAETVNGTILSISDDFGNIDTSISQADLDNLGISIGGNFNLQHNDTMVSVHFGFTYSDVPDGEWVSFINETAKLRFARNYENAAMTLKAEVGDKITISSQ